MIEKSAIALLLLLLVAAYGWYSARRAARDVLIDLRDGAERDDDIEHAPRRRGVHAKHGISSQLVPVLCALVGAVSYLFIAGAPRVIPLLLSAAVGSACGVLASGARERARKERSLREIEFYLPIVMERLVMAVHAGLDVLAGIRVLLELEREQNANDPVTRLLGKAYRLTESGLGFDESLEHVAQEVQSNALRHAFVHLALAYKEGGELVMPLRELSDASQLFYQESVEEEVAKMPVKATMPLLCTFAGLILCFLTVPILQVGKFTSRAGVQQVHVEAAR